MTDQTRGVLLAAGLIVSAVVLWALLVVVGWLLIDVAWGWPS